MTILFTICGRAGSQGVRNKNIRDLNGRPLVYYTLDVVKEFIERHPDEEVYVALNTDSEELKALIRSYPLTPAINEMERKSNLAGNTVGKAEVIRDTYLQMKTITNKEFTFVVDLDITSPLRRLEDIENAIDVMKKSHWSGSPYDVVFSVVPSRRNPYFNMVEKKDDSTFKKVCESEFVSRQQTPEVYDLNGSIYVYNPCFLDREIDRPLLDYKCGISLMKDYLVLDIDSEDDLIMMERLMPFFDELKRKGK